MLESGPTSNLDLSNISDVCDIEITIGNPAAHTMHVSFNFRSDPISGVPTNPTPQIESANGNLFQLAYGDLGGVFNITLVSDAGAAVPDGGSTAMLLGLALAGVGLIGRRIGCR